MQPKIWQNWFVDRFLDLASIINRTRIIGYTVCKWLILVRRNELGVVLLAHELVHVDQLQNQGQIKMMIHYVIESCKHGYMGNAYEVEAYAKQNLPEYQNRARQLLISVAK